jgi:hypothetical protein
MSTINKTVKLTEIECCNCGIDYMVPDWFNKRCLESGVTFYCPAGHPQVYRKSELVKLREQIAMLEGRARHLDDQRQAAERSAAAFKGEVTKLRSRVANGVCPCCHRTFVNVARHMQTKHPDFQDGAS